MTHPRGFRSVRLCLLIATLGYAPITLRAQETVVQNDSISDLGLGQVVGDFIPGEEAAAWLTSPCDGTIVAVQILWLSVVPGAPPTVESNIWIYESGAFPAPGPVLQQLEGPAMMPGFLNEFRSVDKAGTLLAVPVTTGQTFVVSLEFGEPTDVLGGSASIVRDKDGCQAGRNALFASPGVWFNFCSFLQGDVAIRAVVDCGQATGACCLVSGGCTDGAAADVCAAVGGQYQGDNTQCSQTQCPVFDQACCVMPSGCLDFNPDDCAAAGGFPQGPGTTCDTVQCFPVGACCAIDGSCSEVTDTDCAAAGGSFLGPNTTCVVGACPQPEGACCLANDLCFLLQESDCMIFPQAAWSGPSTDCTDADMNGLADACETTCGDIRQDIDLDCDVDLGDYTAFLGCVTGDGGQAADTCLCFDQDADNDVDLLDYGAFMITFTGGGFGCP